MIEFSLPRHSSGLSNKTINFVDCEKQKHPVFIYLRSTALILLSIPQELSDYLIYVLYHHDPSNSTYGSCKNSRVGLTPKEAHTCAFHCLFLNASFPLLTLMLKPTLKCLY